jgi:hypothetical protein
MWGRLPKENKLVGITSYPINLWVGAFLLSSKPPITKSYKPHTSNPSIVVGLVSLQ